MIGNTQTSPALRLEALEAREVPAVIGWVKGGPQPEPPTTPVAGRVKITPVPIPPGVAAGFAPMKWAQFDPQTEPPALTAAWARVFLG